ncbi:MAG: hypothetical protein LUQ53_03875, partial [Methanothrix sp.]|nr:hypothetical protein [Methanothrix sp.]
MKTIILFGLFIFSLSLLPSDAEENLSGSHAAALDLEDYDALQNYSYDEIDAHALAAPASAVVSMSSLAAYWIEPAENDRERARAIFR